MHHIKCFNWTIGEGGGGAFFIPTLPTIFLFESWTLLTNSRVNFSVKIFCQLELCNPNRRYFFELMVRYHNSIISKIYCQNYETWWLCRWLYKVNLGTNHIYIYIYTEPKKKRQLDTRYQCVYFLNARIQKWNRWRK